MFLDFNNGYIGGSKVDTFGLLPYEWTLPWGKGFDANNQSCWEYPYSSIHVWVSIGNGCKVKIYGWHGEAYVVTTILSYVFV